MLFHIDNRGVLLSIGKAMQDIDSWEIRRCRAELLELSLIVHISFTRVPNHTGIVHNETVCLLRRVAILSDLQKLANSRIDC